jgi:hypothetical protein
MLIDKFIDIKISGSKQVTIYSELGFDCKIGDTIRCSIEKLSLGSHLYVKMSCDFCGKEIKKQYNDYNNQTNNGELPISCSDCMNEKRKFSIKKKYNVDNISQLDETKEKVKQTINKKYGCDYLLQSDIIRKKINEKNNINYGVDWNTQRNDFYEKSRLTNLEKYGTEYPAQSTIIKNKIKETFILKYGDLYMKTNDFKNKSKETSLKKYGVEHPSQSIEIKQKTINSNLKKYGVEYPSQSIEIKQKTINSNLEKYGVENPTQLIKTKQKIIDSNLKKYGTEYYSQSSEFKSLIKNRKIPHLKEKFRLNIINIENNVIEYYCDVCKTVIKSDYQLLYNRIGYNTVLCENCNPLNSPISGHEIQLREFIKENYDDDIIYNNRKIISPYEIDIYLPKLKLAFEFNGLFWHNEENKPNNYHQTKTELSEQQDIHLIHIYEDDWLYKQDIVKSRILNLIGKIPNRIYGRKCDVREINDNKLIRYFLNENHIQGFVGGQIKLGLFDNGELVSLMTFGSKRKFMKSNNEDGVYEMLRFCNKNNTLVIGSGDKLFKYFINEYKPVEVISFADRSWSQGDLYRKLGFQLIHKTPPNYYYIVDGIRKHRFNYRKDKLIRDGYNEKLSEHKIMLDRKIYRIYDSGSLKFIKYH